MRLAICNELFAGWPFARICRVCAQLGWQGLELAPFTLAPTIGDLSSAQRTELRRMASDHGLTIVGLHWLLARTNGFHLTSADADVRARTADYLVELARACRDLGGTILVFGSPGQRALPTGVTPDQGAAFACAVIERALPALADAGVTLCIEPLARDETDFVTTCAEGAALVNRIGHPQFRLHLDVKAMASEARSLDELVKCYGGQAAHFHANDASRRAPGFGTTDFVPILAGLRASGYSGWVSVEAFDAAPDPLSVAARSLAYLRRCTAGTPPAVC